MAVYTAAAGTPGLIALLVVGNSTTISAYLLSLLLLVCAVAAVYATIRAHQQTGYELRTISNQIECLLSGEYATRLRNLSVGDAHGDAVSRLSALAETLSRQRLDREESQRLLNKIIDRIDVAILAIDNGGHITLANPAAAALYKVPVEVMLQKSVEQLPEIAALRTAPSGVFRLSFPGGVGKFLVRSATFRDKGRSQTLLFFTDVRRLINTQERRAWQDLIRVLSHEINNSLSPIQSLSNTLSRLLSRKRPDDEIAPHLLDGLRIIEHRSQALHNFIDNYRQLAKLPEPNTELVSILALLDGIKPLFPAYRVQCVTSEDITLNADSEQMQQALINLVQNADQHTPDWGRIWLQWRREEDWLYFDVLDEGAGIAQTENLLVPFYTTRRDGTGIGLPLARQIIEAHGGFLRLENREDARGAMATIELPLA